MDVMFPRLTFKEAQEIFFERTGIDERNEPDLSPHAERELCAWALEKHGTELVFIIDWKTSKRPFYSFPKTENSDLTNTFDLLCAGTEITSGGQRRHTYESMVEGILMKGMDPKNFSDYLSIFKHGMPPHGGFGMGLERLTMTLLKLKNIRETSLFPSDPKRIAGNRIKAHIFFGGQTVKGEILRLLKTKSYSYRHLEHGPTPNLPANARLDMKAVAIIVGEKCEFEDPKVIMDRFGLEIGGIPPFGNLFNIDTFYEESILASETSAFNCGLINESVVMFSKDLVELVNPKLAKFLAV
jgi:nondiscriminating aspartyl-tRNA synthetase